MEFHGDGAPQLALGTINVIFVKPGNDVGSGTRVMSVGRGSDLKARDQALKRARVLATPTLGFSEEDKEVVVTIRIGRYDVKRVLVDQGSGAEIMYPNLYKGLN